MFDPNLDTKTALTKAISALPSKFRNSPFITMDQNDAAFTWLHGESNGVPVKIGVFNNLRSVSIFVECGSRFDSYSHSRERDFPRISPYVEKKQLKLLQELLRSKTTTIWSPNDAASANVFNVAIPRCIKLLHQLPLPIPLQSLTLFGESLNESNCLLLSRSTQTHQLLTLLRKSELDSTDLERGVSLAINRSDYHAAANFILKAPSPIPGLKDVYDLIDGLSNIQEHRAALKVIDWRLSERRDADLLATKAMTLLRMSKPVEAFKFFGDVFELSPYAAPHQCLHALVTLTHSNIKLDPFFNATELRNATSSQLRCWSQALYLSKDIIQMMTQEASVPLDILLNAHPNSSEILGLSSLDKLSSQDITDAEKALALDLSNRALDLDPFEPSALLTKIRLDQLDNPDRSATQIQRVAEIAMRSKDPFCFSLCAEQLSREWPESEDVLTAIMVRLSSHISTPRERNLFGTQLDVFPDFLPALKRNPQYLALQQRFPPLV